MWLPKSIKFLALHPLRDPVERDVIQNIYIRKVEKRDGKLVNVDIETIPMVKDPWKIDHPSATN